MIRRFPTVCLILLSAAWPIRAGGLISYGRTTGSQSFDGHHLDMQLGSDGGHFGGSYDSFSSDASSGTYRTYALRLGQNVGDDSWELFGSITPKVGLYDAQSVGFLINTQSGSTPAGAGSAASLTQSHFGYTRTWHYDGVPQPVRVEENDLLAGLTLTTGKTSLSGNYVRSIYDHDISNLPLRPAAYMPIAGTTQAPQDYPSYSVNGKIEQGIFSWLKAWASYTRVQYKEGSANFADSYTTGTTLTWKIVSFFVQYNRLIPENGATSQYVSGGAGVSF